MAEMPQHWRTWINVHPVAELFPIITGSRLTELSRDIERFEVRVPLVFWLNPENGARLLLDGRNRLEAASLLGRLEPAGKDIRLILEAGQVKMISGIEVEGEPSDIITSHNLHRRDLKPKLRRALVAELLKANPARSNNAIAQLAGSTHNTVDSVRAELEATCQINKLDQTIGIDGKSRRTRYLPRHREGTSASQAQVRNKTIDSMVQLFHADPRAFVEDLAKIFRGDANRIESVPPQERVALARALKLSCDDLPDEH